MPGPRDPRTLAAIAAGLALVTAAGVGVAHARGPAGESEPATVASPARTLLPPAPPGPEPAGTVAPLRRLTAPDVLVSTSRRADRRDVRRLRRVPGVRAVAVLDAGHVRLGKRRLPAVGVDPGEVRGFTPSLTAGSDPLWQSIAGGEAALSYAVSRPFKHSLGATVAVRAKRAMPVRIGAFASLGLGRAQLAVARPVADALGLRPARRLVVSAPHLTVDAIAAAVHRTMGQGAKVHSVRPDTTAAGVSDYARATVPASYLALYQGASRTCPGLPWTVLAGIGAVETWHGTNVHRSSKGAVGPMQFLPSTFAAYGIDGDGDGVADVQDPEDAVYSAARYLCLWGAGRGGQALYDAVWAYNHADWYVRRVFAFANAYAG